MSCSAPHEMAQLAVNLTLGLPALVLVVYATVKAAFMNYNRTTD